MHIKTSDIDWTRPSMVLRVAAEDLQRALDDPQITIAMEEWFFKEKGQCHMCLAGAVLYHRNFVFDSFFRWNEIPDDVQQACAALNYFRAGDVGQFWKLLHPPFTPIPDFARKTIEPFLDSYEGENKRELKTLVEKCLKYADIFEKEGH